MCDEPSEIISHSLPLPVYRKLHEVDFFFFLQHFCFGCSLAVVNIFLVKASAEASFVQEREGGGEPNEKSWMATSLSTTAVSSKLEDKTDEEVTMTTEAAYLNENWC